MKTLYIDINNNPIKDSDNIVCLSVNGSMLDAFFYEVGSKLVGKVSKPIKKTSLMKDFDTSENAEVFMTITNQWNTLKAMLFSEEVGGTFSLTLPKEYISWLSVHSNTDYRDIASQYDKTKDLTITLDVEDFYEDVVEDELEREVLRALKTDSEIEQIVFNDDVVTKRSRIVRDILSKRDVIFVPYERWHQEKNDESKSETKNIGKTTVITLEKEYSEIGIFSCGRCVVKNAESGLYGFIDENGKEVIKCRYKRALQFINEFAWTLYDKCHDWVIIDLFGQYIQTARSSGQGDDKLHVNYPLIEDRGSFYYSDGRNVTGWDRNSSAYYDNGILEIYRNGHTKKEDLRGSIPQPKYNLKVKQKNKKFGVTLDDVDTITTIIPFEYESIEDLHDGFFKLIDETGKMTLCRYNG